MIIATHSTRIRRIVEQVLCRLPESDWLAVERFLRWIRCEREWKSYALGQMLDRRAAVLLPLAKVKREGGEPQAQLVLSLPVCRLYSDEALAGILVLVFARPARAAHFGKGWWRIVEDHRKRENEDAEALAIRWGFAVELRARRSERERVVLPEIDENESRIVTAIARRASAKP